MIVVGSLVVPVQWQHCVLMGNQPKRREVGAGAEEGIHLQCGWKVLVQNYPYTFSVEERYLSKIIQSYPKFVMGHCCRGKHVRLRKCCCWKEIVWFVFIVFPANVWKIQRRCMLLMHRFQCKGIFKKYGKLNFWSVQVLFCLSRGLQMIEWASVEKFIGC